MTDTAERIATIRDFVPRLEALIEGLSDEQLTTQYNAPEWTIAQNVHHLLDAHVNSYLFFKRVLTEDNPGLKWPEQDGLANLPDAGRADIKPSLKALDGLHFRWADTLDNIDDWTRQATSLKSGKIYTLDDLLSMYDRHCKNHIQQIQEVLDAM